MKSFVPFRITAGLLAVATVAFAQTPPNTGPAKSGEIKTKSLSKEEEAARAAFVKGDLETCLAEFQKAIKINPNLPPAKILLASLFLESNVQNAGSNARELVESAAAEDPRHPDIYLANGNLAFKEGRTTEAILNLQTCLKLSEDPRFDAEQRERYVRESRTGLVFCFERRRDFLSVKEQLQALLAKDPKNAMFRARLAITDFNLGNTESAFADLQTAFRDDPLQNPPELQMGLLWAGRQDEAKAEEWLKKAVTTHPNDVRTHRGYAGWLIDVARFDAAKPYLEAAEKIAPNARDTLFLKGLLFRYLKQYDESEKVFEVLVRDSATDIQAAGNLALVLCESDDVKKKKRGIDLAESVVRQNPRAAEAYSVAGWSYYKSGRIDDAEKSLTEAARAGQGQVNLDTAYYLSKVLYDRGKFDEVYKVLKSAVDKKGPFVNRKDAAALLAEVEKKLPAKKEEPKKP